MVSYHHVTHTHEHNTTARQFQLCTQSNNIFIWQIFYIQQIKINTIIRYGLIVCPTTWFYSIALHQRSCDWNQISFTCAFRCACSLNNFFGAHCSICIFVWFTWVSLNKIPIKKDNSYVFNMMSEHYRIAKGVVCDQWRLRRLEWVLEYIKENMSGWLRSENILCGLSLMTVQIEVRFQILFRRIFKDPFPLKTNKQTNIVQNRACAW